MNAIISLRNDPDIVLLKPDKGNGVVILNRSDYVKKMQTILNDKENFYSAIRIATFLTLPNSNAPSTISNLKKLYLTRLTLKFTPHQQPHHLSTDFLNCTNLEPL